MPPITKLLETSDTSRYLGVSIIDNLTWSSHDTAITAGKANRVLGFLRRNINDCSTKVKAISYITMVRPIMKYAYAAWDTHLQKHISQVERVQWRAARFCCGDYTNRTPGCVDDMLKVLHWESLETRRKNNRLSILHKINTGACWHHHRPVPPTEWPKNSRSPTFSSCKGRPPSLLPFRFPCDI